MSDIVEYMPQSRNYMQITGRPSRKYYHALVKFSCLMKGTYLIYWNAFSFLDRVIEIRLALMNKLVSDAERPEPAIPISSHSTKTELFTIWTIAATQLILNVSFW